MKTALLGAVHTLHAEPARIVQASGFQETRGIVPADGWAFASPPKEGSPAPVCRTPTPAGQPPDYCRLCKAGRELCAELGCLRGASLGLVGGGFQRASPPPAGTPTHGQSALGSSLNVERLQESSSNCRTRSLKLQPGP